MGFRIVFLLLLFSYKLQRLETMSDVEHSELIMSVSRQEVIQLKSPILLKLAINVGFGEQMIMAKIYSG